MRESQQDSQGAIWKIVLGVAGGMLLASVIGWVVRVWMVNAAVEQGISEVQRISRMPDPLQQGAVQALEAERRKAEDRERELLFERSEQERVTQDGIRAEKQRAWAMDGAWAAAYRKPSRCLDPADMAAMTQCANEYIRARRAFEEQLARKP